MGNQNSIFLARALLNKRAKTKTISKLDFLAVVDDDRWTWTIHTRVPVRAEVFELSSPALIIIDLKP